MAEEVVETKEVSFEAARRMLMRNREEETTMMTDWIPLMYEAKGDGESKEAMPTTEGIYMLPTTIGEMSTELTDEDIADHTLVVNTIGTDVSNAVVYV